MKTRAKGAKGAKPQGKLTERQIAESLIPPSENGITARAARGLSKPLGQKVQKTGKKGQKIRQKTKFQNERLKNVFETM